MSGHLPPDHPAWRLMHSYYLDAMSTQKQVVVDALADIGTSFQAFQDACDGYPFVISAHFADDGLHYVLSVRTPRDTIPLVKVHSSRLLLDDIDTELDELSWKLRDRSAEN